MDQNNLLNDVTDYKIEMPATVGQRFVNYLIDVIVFYALMFGVGLVLGVGGVMTGAEEESLGIMYLLIFGVFFGYYILLEGSSKGKTVGKMVSKTRVVNLDGHPIDYGTAFLRTLIRMIPFEFLSVFAGGGQMWHDKWTKTKLIQE